MNTLSQPGIWLNRRGNRNPDTPRREFPLGTELVNYPAVISPRNQVLDDTCAVAHALGTVGDGWTLLIVRDLARGIDRFDGLVTSLSISRKVLTERLRDL